MLSNWHTVWTQCKVFYSLFNFIDGWICMKRVTRISQTRLGIVAEVFFHVAVKTNYYDRYLGGFLYMCVMLPLCFIRNWWWYLDNIVCQETLQGTFSSAQESLKPSSSEILQQTKVTRKQVCLLAWLKPRDIYQQMSIEEEEVKKEILMFWHKTKLN